MTLQRFANFFLLAFCADGVLSLTHSALQLLGGGAALTGLQRLAALTVLLAAPIYYVALFVTPRLPKRIFLPLLLATFWWTLGAAPLPLLVAERWLPVLLSALQVLLAGLALAQVRAASGGARWLFTGASLSGPGFRWRNTLGFAAANVLLGPPLLAGLGALSLAGLLERHTAGFIGFDAKGVMLRHRTYVQGDREIHLVGMMHVGEGEAYRELFESFHEESTLVLEEGVSDRTGRLEVPLSYGKLAARLGLEVQPALEEWIGRLEEASEGAAPWPHVWNADVDLADFSSETVEFLEEAARVWDSEDLLAALRDFEAYLDAGGAEGILETVWGDLIDLRNRHLLEQLTAALEDYRRIVIPWGALHLPEVEQDLLARGFERSASSERRLVRYATVLAALLP